MQLKLMSVFVGIFILTACSPMKPAPQSSIEVAQPSPHEQAAAITFIGNPTSRIFHTSNCPYLPADGHRTFFTNRTEAISANYRPCKFCNP